MLLRTESDPCIESHSRHAAFPMHTLPCDSSHSASSPTMRVTRPAGRGMVRPHGSASTNANSDAPSLLMTCVDSQPGSRWSRGDAEDERQRSRERIAMKERTSLAEECGWSASLPVWASSKEAVSVEAVSTAIQSSNQRDRVRVTTARDVGADPSNRRIATCAPLKDYSSEHESDVNVRRGGGAWSYVKSTTPLHTRRIMDYADLERAMRVAGRGDRRRSAPVSRLVTGSRRSALRRSERSRRMMRSNPGCSMGTRRPCRRAVRTEITVLA